MSDERFTLDTNILVYSVDRRAGARHKLAKDIVLRAVRCDCWLTLQAVSEFYAAVTRKGLVPPSEAAAQASDWLELFPTVSASSAAVRNALAAATSGRAAYWDALLLTSAAGGGCAAVLTEDLSDGAILEGVRIIHPFAGDALSAPAVVLLGPSPAHPTRAPP